MSDYLQETTLERSATGHTDAEVPPYGDLTGSITPLGTWTSATTTDDALCPAQNGQVTFHISDSSWMTANDWIVLVGFGTFKVESKPDATHVIATYLPSSAQTPNTTPLNTLIPSGTRVMVGSFSDTADSSAGLYYRWTDKSHDYIAGGEVDGIGVKAMYNVVKVTGSVPGTVLWANVFNSSGYAAAATDSNGNIYVGGYFYGSVDFGTGTNLTSAGDADIFVAKYGATGVAAWSKRFGSSGSDIAIRISADGSGNVLVFGNFAGTVDFGGVSLTSVGGSDSFLLKLAGSNGSRLWVKQLSGGQQFARGLAIDRRNNDVLVTGSFTGTTDFGLGNVGSYAGSGDSFVAKYASGTGSCSWARNFICSDADQGKAVAVDNAGNVFVLGEFRSQADFGGGPISGHSLTGFGFDVYVVKLDPSGGYVWSKGFGGPNNTSGTGMAVDKDGNVVLTGRFQSSIDFGGGHVLSDTGSIFVAKLSGADGGCAWANKAVHSTGGTQISTDLVTDSDGSVLITGYFDNVTVNFGNGDLLTAGGRDVFVARFTNLGVCNLSKRFGGGGDDYGYGVAVDAAKNIIVVGTTSGGGFGTFTLGSGIFLCKISG